jgi:hypothetical protein
LDRRCALFGRLLGWTCELTSARRYFHEFVSGEGAPAFRIAADLFTAEPLAVVALAAFLRDYGLYIEPLRVSTTPVVAPDATAARAATSSNESSRS